MPVLIKRGHRGPEVRSIQARLNLDAGYGHGIAAGYSAHARLVEDGIYGQKTLQRVIEWQRVHGLKPDGIVGPNTWQAMFGQPAPANTAGSPSATAGSPSAAGNAAPTRGVLYVHAHDAPGKGEVGSIHKHQNCHQVIVPAGKAAEAPEMMRQVIVTHNLTLTDMVLNTHGGGAGRVSIGGAMIDLQQQPRFFKAVKGHFAPSAVLRIMACAFAVSSVPGSNADAWLVSLDELRYGPGIKALQVVARYLGVECRAGFGMQFGDMSGFTGVWVSCQPDGNYRYHLRGRAMGPQEFLDMVNAMLDAAARHVIVEPISRLGRWLTG